MPDLVMIYNSSAGGASEAARDAALAILREGADVAQAAVERPAEIGAVLGAYPDRRPVAAGGDGTLHSTRPVGLIPLGTGNDFAGALGLPDDPAAAARIVLEGRDGWLDLLVDDADGIAVNAVHLGVGAAASHTAAPLKPLLRRLAYPVGGVLAGLRSPGWRLRVRVDGQTVADGRRRVLQVAIGNGHTIGGGTPLTPDAEPDDGRADVLVAFATSPGQRLAYGIRLRRSRHTEHPEVVTMRGQRVEVAVTGGVPVPVNADGELSDPVTRRGWHLRPRAWRMALPAPGAPAR
jgi:diacylglycerol kinase family enzyme